MKNFYEKEISFRVIVHMVQVGMQNYVKKVWVIMVMLMEEKRNFEAILFF